MAILACKTETTGTHIKYNTRQNHFRSSSILIPAPFALIKITDTAVIVIQKGGYDIMIKNISFEGIKNVRDFENIKNHDGLSIRPKRIFRSGDLSRMTDHDVKRLTDEYRLKTIIDLRTHDEIKQRPTMAINGVTQIHIPILEEKTIGITRESEHPFDLNDLPEMSELYENMVEAEYSVLQIKKAVEIIMDGDHQPVLFHCTAGKDRTGIISMCLLSMLDVSFSAILEDYLYTNHTAQAEAQAYYEMVCEKTANESFAENIRNIFLAKEDYLRSAMDRIHRNYGGIQNFISQKLHITGEQIEAFQNAVLVKDDK